MAVFENNPSAQDFNIQTAINAKDGLMMSHIKTSGRTDKFFFLPMDLPHLQEELGKIIGTQTLVPKWALGWHMSQRGMPSTKEMQTHITKMQTLNFPIDGIWSDSDYMENGESFTFDL